MLCFFIACCGICILCRKTLALIDRVVQLGVCIRHLPAVDEKLEALYLARIVRTFLGQRRDLDRVVHDKGRLDQLIFAVLLEEEADDVAAFMMCFKLDMFFFCKRFYFVLRCDLIEVDAGFFLDGVNHGQTAEGLTKVDFLAVINDFCTAADCLSQVTVHIFCQIHHAVIVCVGLIEFHQSKLRIVTGVHAFITEYAADFIDAL